MNENVGWGKFHHYFHALPCLSVVSYFWEDKEKTEEVQCVKTDESKMVGGADFDGLLLRR